MKVRVGATYIFDPVFFDVLYPPANIALVKGDLVKVINLPRSPFTSAMGMCYVAKDGVFAGMVMTNSLKRKGAT